MLDNQSFRKYAHQLVDWMADYLENVAERPVQPQVKPYAVYGQLPESPPTEGEAIETILADFERVIVPNMTHWQSPNFYAYFPANSSYESVLGEMLTATIGAQCMIWDTSPAAAELEMRMMEWMREGLGLPTGFVGVLQDTASTATLCALLTARERATGFIINEKGFEGNTNFAIYCSTDAHSSIEKAVKIAGFGREALRQVPTDERRALRLDLLERALEADVAQGIRPLCVVAAFGTTSTIAFDPLAGIAALCRRYGVWLHVDAAYAGSVLFLPAFRQLAEGIEHADSFVFNPHKWLFVNFDCSAYFVKDADALVRTFAILPEYLKTANTNRVRNYRDWGVPLGRRFRALKLWFVLRSYGLEGIRAVLQSHLEMGEWVAAQIEAHADFQHVAPPSLNGVFFRLKPDGCCLELDALNALNAEFLQRINATGKCYLTHTKINEIYLLRMVIGQTYVTQMHVAASWQLITKIGELLLIEVGFKKMAE